MCFRSVLSVTMVLSLLVTSSGIRYRPLTTTSVPDDYPEDLDYSTGEPKLAFVQRYLVRSLVLLPGSSSGTAAHQRLNTTPDIGGSFRFNISVWDREIRVHYDRDADSIFLPDAQIRIIRSADDVAESDLDPLQERIKLDGVVRDFVRGRVEGDSASSVLGYLTRPSGAERRSRGSTFDGVIATDGDVYHVESAANFFDDSSPFDSVVYRDSDLSATPEDDSGTAIACPTLGRTHAAADPVSEKAVGHGLSSGVSRLLSSIVLTGHSSGAAGAARSFRIEGNLADDDSPVVDAVSRRAQGTECHLRLVIDRSFYRDFAGGDAKRAVREVGQRVREVDRFFRSVDFNGDGKPDGIGFRIKAIDILDREEETDDRTSDDAINPEDQTLAFLTRLVGFDFSDVCLGFMFTNRPLYGATTEGKRRASILGAAFTGSLGLPTGACSSRVSLHGPDRRMASFNSGLVTLRFDDSGRVVPRARNVLAIAHEFGHAFGASHDDERHEAEPSGKGRRDRRLHSTRLHACDPEGWKNKFLMTSASPLSAAISDANRRFSGCSRAAIKNYLNAKGSCLTSKSR